MKYVVMFTSQPELDAAVPQERQQEIYQQIFGWFQQNAASITNNGAELQPPSTATTVKSPTEPGGEPIVIDGPFSEAKESIGGFSVIDVADLDAAIALVRTWPNFQVPGVAVEIRPMVEYPSE